MMRVQSSEYAFALAQTYSSSGVVWSTCVVRLMAGLQFKGKPFVQNYHLTVKYHKLNPKKDKSLTDKVNLHDNLIIHGDNLIALKALLPTYAGKINCVYIDPPYNTGKERWAYNDNVDSPMMQEWLGKIVDSEDLTRHDKWLCMMTPRLKLLSDLLRDDGVILVSVEDHEVHHLRMLMDEIFLPENFITHFVWNTEGHTDNQFQAKVNHEYVIAYAKTQSASLGYVIDPNTTPDSNLWKGFAENSITKNGPGNPPSEVRLPVGFPCIAENMDLEPTKVKSEFFRRAKNLRYISRELTKKFGVTYPIRKDQMTCRSRALTRECRVFSGWANVKKLKAFIENDCKPIQDEKGNILAFFLSKDGVIYYKRSRKRARNILTVLRNMGTTEQMRSELERRGIDFPYPKPKKLIKYLLQIGLDGEGIVLDSFAGSGTTAHAVLELNKEEGNGKRKFILVECEDYADRTTAERVRSVIKGVPRVSEEELQPLGGTFSYFDLGEPIEINRILEGKELPSYIDLARYIFYTATGEEFDEAKVDEKHHYVGESREYAVHLFYKPEIQYLRQAALTIETAKELKPSSGRKRLVFAPTKYIDEDHLLRLGIVFAQIPFEIYRMKR